MRTGYTKEHALKLSIKLWTVLAETGCTKLDAVQADPKFTGLLDDKYHCPLCAYANEQLDTRGGDWDLCSHCPVWQGEDETCRGRGSLIDIWWQSDNLRCKKEAANVVLQKIQHGYDKYKTLQNDTQGE